MSEARTCPYCRGRSRRGGICRKCQDATTKRLGELPGWWDDLQTAVIRQSKLEASGGPASGDQWKWPYDVRASFTAEAIAKTIAEWFQYTVTLGADAMPGARTPEQLAQLIAWHPTISRSDRYREFVDDVHRLTNRIMRVVDHPDVKARIEVGPCYLEVTDADGMTSPCTGTVHAYIPTEGGEVEWPPFMGCDQEEEHWWDTTRWKRAGVAIRARQTELAKASELAKAIGAKR